MAEDTKAQTPNVHCRPPQQTISADRPIDAPDQDLFGYDPFARAVATGIAGLTDPDGLVLGIHGPWGSGKSSAVNLVKYHLRSGHVANAADLVQVEFNPWWFNGADALALAFFRELGAAMEQSLPDRAKQAFEALGRRLVGASPLIEAAVNFATLGTGGAAAGSVAKMLGDAIGGERTIVEEHGILAEALRKAGRRYLVIIDDLDRLSADDALLIFKLVKSVGRLPNVIYLMVFDRALTEEAVEKRFPSEGAHFLEKIVQASFELPPSEPDDLRSMLLDNVGRIMGDVEDGEMTRFMNLFFDVVATELKRARDVVRLTNLLEVTWPAVRDDVDKADFLAIETLRLFRPGVHRAVYHNMDYLCRHQLGDNRQVPASEDADNRLLDSVSDDDRPAMRKALMRLFPALENAWKNTYHGSDRAVSWRRARRICTKLHFPTYFRLEPSDQVSPATEIGAFLTKAGNEDFVRTAMREALASKRRRGGTRAAVLLDEVAFRADKVPPAAVLPLLSALFSIADELNVASDEARGFSIGDNQLRLHWLINRLIGERFAMPERDAMIEKAAAGATPIWLVSLALRCRSHHEPDEGETREGEPLVSIEAADRIVAMALERVEAMAADNSLLGQPDLVSRLLRWRDLIGDGGVERVRAWLADRLDDATVIALAGSFVSTGWSHAAGDAVSRRYTSLAQRAVENLVDPVQFRERVKALRAGEGLDPQSKAALDEFEAAWLRAQKGELND